MTRPVDVVERVGQWQQAYAAIREELTAPASRELLGLMMESVKGDGPAGPANIAMALARLIAANDRAAAFVAAMLTSTGIRPVPTGLVVGDEGSE